MISNTGGLGKISPEIALLDKPGCGPLVGLVKKIDLIKLDGGVGRDAKKWVQPSISSRSDGIEILNPTSAEIYPDGAAFRHHPGKIRGPAEIVGPASETGPDPYGYGCTAVYQYGTTDSYPGGARFPYHLYSRAYPDGDAFLISSG